eukprot:10804441-Ditylum_brightwellii.AAC.1
MSQVQILVVLPVVEMRVKTCIKEASWSVKLSGCSAYGESYTIQTTEAGSQNNLRRSMPCVSPACHPGEGKKLACESERCVR